MKNLLFILIAALFFIGCKKNPITPPNNSNNNNQNPQSVNFKSTTATIIDSKGDTIVKNWDNIGWENELTIFNEKLINQPNLKYVRAITNLNSTNPVSVSMSFYDTIPPTVQTTDKLGTEDKFMQPFQVVCRVYADGESWVSMPAQYDGSNQILNVTDLGNQTVQLIKATTNNGFASQTQVVSETFHVYEIEGKVDGDFNLQGTTTSTQTFTVLYKIKLYLQP